MIITNPQSGEQLCLAVSDKELILREDGNNLSFEDLKTLQLATQSDILISEPENGITALMLKNRDNMPDGYTTETLRMYCYGKDEETTARIFRAKALLEWRKKSIFCQVCGAPMKDHPTLTAVQCSSCKELVFPRIEPCVIVLVNKGEEILLARHANRNTNMYACIAGFMEAGETAEQAVAREVKEETGLTVKNIKYFGTQSWPFPSQLMIAFTAEYDSGEIKVQEEEICDARWFSRDNLPTTPQPGSIAYRLINRQC